MTLTLTDVSVSVRDGASDRLILDAVNLHVAEGSLAVTGPSGSGKSTLLRVMAGLVSGQGQVILDGTAVGERGRALDRRFSFVHQDHKILDFLTVEENIRVGADVRGESWSEDQMTELLEAVSLEGLRHRRPEQLSGGELQRVGIARAIACRPRVLLADEPTGSLDTATSRQVVDLLLTLCNSNDCILVVVTHDESVASRMDQRAIIRDGCLLAAETNGANL